MKKHSLFKSITVFLVLFVSCLCLTLTVFADEKADVVISLQIDNPLMKVNGNELEIDEGRGTTPVVLNNRTLVPIRAIIDALGGSVEWINETRSVVLIIENDKVELFIDKNEAYYNGALTMLDVPPMVINERTMLPIRFVAESFNLSVAWDNNTKTVFIVKNSIDEDEYNYLSLIPPYSGEAFIEVNEGVPFFEEFEKIPASFEFYSELDEYNRCSVAFASVGVDIMPTEERESISSVQPTGWVNEKYDIVDGGYLYNRCHLIGFQLTGENANERNLITGTRYLNISGMLPFENLVDDYVEDSSNHVMYRVTPLFKNGNLVAEGVLLEGYSVEDNGEGVSFCVFCYNVQPGIDIDYKTGQNKLSGTEERVEENAVYRTPSGKKYHFDMECGGKNSFPITIEEALKANLEPCSKCVK